MLYFLLGISISAIIFLYYSLFFKGEKAVTTKDHLSKQDDLRKPRIRSCPICGAPMGMGDQLYGEIYRAEPRDKVTIKGCLRCYARPAKSSGNKLSSIN